LLLKHQQMAQPHTAEQIFMLPWLLPLLLPPLLVMAVVALLLLLLLLLLLRLLLLLLLRLLVLLPLLLLLLLLLLCFPGVMPLPAHSPAGVFTDAGITCLAVAARVPATKMLICSCFYLNYCCLSIAVLLVAWPCTYSRMQHL